MFEHNSTDTPRPKNLEPDSAPGDSTDDSWNDRLLYRLKQTVQKAVRIPKQPENHPKIAANADSGLYSSVRQIAQNRVSVALKQLRAQHGLSYEQIQRNTGLSQQLLWDVEFNNRRLSLDELRLLVDGYGLSVNDILGVDVDSPTLDKLKIHDQFSLPRK